MQAGFLRRTVTENPCDHDARTSRQTKRLRQFLSQRLHFDTQPAANHLAVLDDRLHHFHRQFDRDRETDALGAAGLGEDRRVDAGQVAIGIHQRAAGVAGVDRGVGLDEVFVVVQAQLITPGGADDAHGHGLADAERVADGQGHVADADVVGAADGDRRQVFQIDLQHREVGFRVAADHAGQGFTAVLERDHDLVGAAGHVVVGQDVAFRAHDHAGTEARLHALLLGRVVAEKAAELRVFKQRMVRLVDDFGGVQVHHRRRGGGHCVGIRHRTLLHAGGLRGLLQVDVEAWKPDPLRVTLDYQQSDKHAGQQRPAGKTQRLEH